jgi:ABC-2 type transport system ATP-binding protein
VREFILELKKEKKTIFLNTHNLDEAQRICDRIGILNTRLMAIGTPEELERSVGARRTVIQLEQINDSILNSVKKLSLGNVSRDDSKLTIELANPFKENPAIIRAIVEAGGNIQTVFVSTSSLEDAYLKLVREQE